MYITISCLDSCSDRGPLEIRRSIIFLRAGAVEFLGGSSLENSVPDGQGSQHQARGFS